MKISIITVTLNNKAGLIRAIESVRSQTYRNVEHIIVDGGSTDGTIETIKNLQLTIYNLQFLSEADTGIYDAINKGIKLATGDVIGLLHSDDFYADEKVLERYAEVFELTAEGKKQSAIEVVYSDLVYVKNKSKVKGQKSRDYTNFQSTDHLILRYWKTQKEEFTKKTQRHRALKRGWMPPHPTLFLRREVFEKYGMYRTDMKIAADYEMILRLFYKHKITAHYLPLTTYCMTIGGASNKSLKNIFQKSKEDYRAMKINGINLPLFTLMYKNFRKLPQFVTRDY